MARRIDNKKNARTSQVGGRKTARSASAGKAEVPSKRKSTASSKKQAGKPARKPAGPAADNTRKVKPPHFRKHKTSGHVAKRYSKASGPKKSTAPEGMVRIQKFLSETGLASRRTVEEMIVEGRIAVNGRVVEELPCFVDPRKDDVFVDGKRVRRKQHEKVYLLVNKPKGVLCTASDPQGRKCLVDMLGDFPERVYCVGRLDADSTGLIIMTNDGELTQHLTHPSHEVDKTYNVTVEGRVTGEDLEKLRGGIYLDGTRTQGVQATKIIRRTQTGTALEMTLTEGRNREIRRVLRRIGHKVRKLSRIAIGPIKDTTLAVGHFRPLTDREVNWLRQTGLGGKKTNF